MKRLQLNCCPICRGVHLAPLFETVDHFASGEKFDIFQCDSCGFRFTQNFPDQRDMGKYYESDEYVSHSNTKKGVVHHIYHIARSVMLKKKRAIVEQATKLTTGRILDIGCGTGFFLNEMQTNKWVCEGVEVSTHAAKYARENFGLNIHTSLNQIDTKDQFDVITLWHVLEHLQNLPETFAQLRMLLKPDGVLVVALPNCTSYDAEIYQNDWAAYDVPRHLWHFSPDTFNHLVNREGFLITNLAPMPLDAYYVSMLSEKNLGRKFSFARGLATGTKALLSSIGNPKKSSSIIYLLKFAQ